jgi:hypothetical protein
MQTLVGLTLQDRDGGVIAQCQPQAGQTPIDLPQLQRLIDEAGFGQWLPLATGQAELLERWVAEGAEPFEVAVARREDAHCTVEVASDNLCAWVQYTAARGGQSARLEDVLQGLFGAGVVFGIDQALVEQLCQDGKDAKVVAAHAKLAVDGEDARFELLVKDTRDRAPKVDETGLIDYHELGDIPTVQAGQSLMRRHPATPGVDGCDVRGAPLRAKPGIDAPFGLPLLGAAQDARDPNLLVAVDAGQPVRTKDGVVVEKVLRLKGVSLATGNIHFVGTVEVMGDVSPGMKVEASGDIVVKGLVEGSHLEAGGSVQVVGGVIAHSAVRAVHSVAAKFVENSALHAGTTVMVENMALHSDLQALNQVIVGNASGSRGRLVGGTTRATMLVRVPQLGAAAGGVTKVFVGLSPAFLARYQALEHEIQHEHDEADKLEKIVLHLQAHGDPRHLLAKVKEAWQAELKQWGHLLEEKAEFEHQVALTGAARIEVRGEVAGDVDVGFGKLTRQVRNSRGGGHFDVDDQGRVVFHPANGAPAEIV